MLLVNLPRGPFPRYIITYPVMQSARKRPISNMLSSGKDWNDGRSESKFFYV